MGIKRRRDLLVRVEMEVSMMFRATKRVGRESKSMTPEYFMVPGGFDGDS
jgi:hypothetical protein